MTVGPVCNRPAKEAGCKPAPLIPSEFPTLPSTGRADEPVSTEPESLYPQARLPPGPGSDAGRVGEQAVLLLLPGQPGELPVQRVVGGEERLLAVQDGRVGTPAVVVAVQLARAQRQPDAAQQGGMRV